MGVLRAAMAILGRIFLSVPFLVSGVNKMFYWKDEEKGLMNVIADWQTYTVSSEWLQVVFSEMAVFVPVLLMIIALLEIGGGVLLLTGYKEKLGAALLAIVLLFTMVLIQHFWFSEANMKEMQFSLFLRDLAILGGLMIVALQGTDGGCRIEEFDRMGS